MKEKLYRFMQGRYGTDAFNRFLLGAAMVSIVLSFFRLPIFYLLSLFLLGYVYFRMLSKNISRRYAENAKYLAVTARLRAGFQKEKNTLRQRKTHHIYKCPSCKQKIRVPRGKGRIEITCPKCRTGFVKKS